MAHETGTAVMHDFAYGDLVFDGREPRSFLATPGAKEVGVELFSMSKSYGMAGWRLGFVLGNAEIVARIELLQDHVRAGIFRPIQEAGIAALTGPQDTVEERRALYEARRDRVLAALGPHVPEIQCEGSFFVWLRLPEGVTADGILDEQLVALAPGEGFGETGRGWARISLATPDERLDTGLERLAAAFADVLSRANRLALLGQHPDGIVERGGVLAFAPADDRDRDPKLVAEPLLPLRDFRIVRVEPGNDEQRVHGKLAADLPPLKPADDRVEFPEPLSRLDRRSFDRRRSRPPRPGDGSAPSVRPRPAR